MNVSIRNTSGRIQQGGRDLKRDSRLKAKGKSQCDIMILLKEKVNEFSMLDIIG